MKILIIRTFPNILSLQHYNVQEIGLARELVRAGHECGIVLYTGLQKSHKEYVKISPENENANPEKLDSVAGSRQIVIYWQKGINLLKNGFFFGLSKIMKEYDVIQVHEYDQLLSWWVYSNSKKPVVIYHGPYYDAFNRGYNLKCRIFDHIFLNMRRHTEVICMTKSCLAEEFLRVKGFSRVTTIGVGLDDTLYRSHEQQIESRQQDKSIRLLYVGKLEKRRNLYFIEKLFRKLQQSISVHLTIIGAGEDEYAKHFLENIKDLIDSGKITYITRMSQEELIEVYCKNDILLFSTNYDIFGMVLLEAMYCGMICMSTINGGAVSLIRDRENGYLYRECDLELWSERIRMLSLDSEELQRLQNAARKEVKEKYTWRALVPGVMKQYENAIQVMQKKEKNELYTEEQK